MIKEQIKNFYNQQSKKRDNTRKKPWPEFQVILERIKKTRKKNIKILDLGCGNARLLDFLTSSQDIHKKNINYVGVDLSENLIKIVQEKFPNSTFQCSDMIEFLEGEKQEDYDFVFMVASFQHIPIENERLLILKNIYRILKYKWELLSINWCFSKWFIQKYKKSITKSLLKTFISLWYHKFNDLYIPWKWELKIYQRYYHIFTEKEKKELLLLSWFVLQDFIFLDNKWEKVSSYKWRNSIAVAKKDVIY